MIDDARFEAKLGGLSEYMDVIKGLLPKDQKAYVGSDIALKYAIERSLQLISDTEFDTLAILYKGLEIKVVGDELSMLDVLADRMGAKLADSLRKRRALRNRLVHAYASSSYDKDVFQQAHNLDDVRDFIREVKKLASHPK